jgi:thiol-disulfide isomerase/thioredoxin
MKLCDRECGFGGEKPVQRFARMLAIAGAAWASWFGCVSNSSAQQDQERVVVEPVTEVDDVLVPGSVAPSLAGLQWLKGDELAAPEEGVVYVIDAWATWCIPCERTIPHLARIAKAYKAHKVRVIGVSVWEQRVPLPADAGGATIEQRVKDYVQRRSDKMAYSVAWDKEGTFERAWMRGARRVSIPTAFIVDRQGKIAWYGHPLIGLDEALADVVAGTFDADAAFERARQREAKRVQGMKLASPLQIATREQKWDEAIALSGQLYEIDREMFAASGVSKARFILTYANEADAIAFVQAEQAMIAAKSIAEQAKHLEALAGWAEAMLDGARGEPSKARAELAASLAEQAQTIVRAATSETAEAAIPTEATQQSKEPAQPPALMHLAAADVITLTSVCMRLGQASDAGEMLKAAKTLDPDPSQALQIEMLERQLALAAQSTNGTDSPSANQPKGDK